MTSQTEVILAALRGGERLTQLDAISRFGCTRLAARIHELREQGYAVQTRTIKTRTGKRIAEYSMKAS
jgi:predicted amidohydrolase